MAAWKLSVAQAAKTYGPAVEIKTIDGEISGDMARVSYTYRDLAINQDREPWLRESGQWRNDDC